MSTTRPKRDVFQAEAFAWLENNPALPGTSVITSLPDSSELPALSFEAWEQWFCEAARRVLRWLPADGAAIFYQSDVRRQGRWVDKGHLVLRAADGTPFQLLWHKIACRKPPGTITHGRASYSHLLCFSRPRPAPRHPGPDVIVETALPAWPKAMGLAACRAACRFLAEETPTRVVVDPFCGRGTALAVANELGFDAIGVDHSSRCCRAARKLLISDAAG